MPYFQTFRKRSFLRYMIAEINQIKRKIWKSPTRACWSNQLLNRKGSLVLKTVDAQAHGFTTIVWSKWKMLHSFQLFSLLREIAPVWRVFIKKLSSLDADHRRDTGRVCCTCGKCLNFQKSTSFKWLKHIYNDSEEQIKLEPEEKDWTCRTWS